MAMQPAPTYPGGSKERVRRAGERVRSNTATPDDLAVIDIWRAAHRPVLNTFQAILRTRTRHQNILVAQRHKRKNTIFGKLHRFPGMALHRMDDVAGCRLIFDSIEELYTFRESLHAAKFKHKRRHADNPDKYDYIKNPNPETGYRGVHDIYEYDENLKYADQYRGLMIELQYRTHYQHAWATCVEVIGHITESQPKFQQGDDRYREVLKLASEIISRAFEGLASVSIDLSDEELIRKFTELDGELGFIRLLRGINSANADGSQRKTSY